MQVALGQTKFSKDGKLMAYTLSSGGSDWVYIKVLTIDQETGETTDLEDKLEYVKFSSLAWTHDHKVGCELGHSIATSFTLSDLHLMFVKFYIFYENLFLYFDNCDVQDALIALCLANVTSSASG